METKENGTINGATSALFMAMLAMIIAFAIWASLSPMATQLQKLYQLSITQKSILVAIPVLLGSVMRIPLGIWTDRYGGKKLYTWLMIFLIIPTIGISFANSFALTIFWAFFIGMAGTSFAVAIAYVSKFYPPEKQGLILGVVAVGNIGTAVANFTIPTLVNFYGIPTTFWILAISSGITAILFSFATKEMPLPKQTKTMAQSLSVLKYKQTWTLSLFYFVTFGAFVAFGIYLPTLLQDLFQLTPVDAGLRAAGFVVLATIVRPIGGYFADKWTAGKVLNIVKYCLYWSGGGSLNPCLYHHPFYSFYNWGIRNCFFCRPRQWSRIQISPRIVPKRNWSCHWNCRCCWRIRRVLSPYSNGDREGSHRGVYAWIYPVRGLHLRELYHQSQAVC
ncbi:MAG: nitrate/nitrite transporter [Tepidibacillus sp.]